MSYTPVNPSAIKKRAFFDHVVKHCEETSHKQTFNDFVSAFGSSYLGVTRTPGTAVNRPGILGDSIYRES